MSELEAASEEPITVDVILPLEQSEDISAQKTAAAKNLGVSESSIRSSDCVNTPSMRAKRRSKSNCALKSVWTKRSRRSLV